MNYNGTLSKQNFSALEKEAELNATNDLRRAIYDYGLKTISNLQLINGKIKKCVHA